MTNKLTAKEAAEQVLKETEYPMSILEIYEYAVDKLHWRVRGKKPKINTMEDTLKRNTGDRGPFVLIKSRFFGLRQYVDRYKKDILYVLENPAMPGYLKIGITNKLEQRRRSLSYPTGVPRRFEILYAVRSRKARKFEEVFKKIFSKNRVDNSEFFEGIKVEQNIKPVIELHKKDMEKVIVDEGRNTNSSDSEKAPSPNASLSPKSATATSQPVNIKPKKTGHTGPFNFRNFNIPRGTTLTLKGSPSITCKVYDDTQVKYRGEVMSVSRAAILAKKSSTALAGTLYWQHKGKTLHAIRNKKRSKSSVVSSSKGAKHTELFSFRKLKIPREVFLTFIKDNSITCRVHNDTQVRYKGEIMSLSKAAGLAKGGARKLWGPKFWKYEGELLFSRRKRIRQTK